MGKVKRLKRPELVDQIVKKVNLPPGKESKGYFTTEQLKELLIKLDNLLQAEAARGAKETCLREQITTR